MGLYGKKYEYRLCKAIKDDKMKILVSYFYICILFCFSDVESDNIDLHSAMFRAVENSDLDSISFLFTKGVNVNAKNDNKQTLLEVAIEKGNEQLVKNLLELGANVNGSDKYGYPLLSRAAEKSLALYKTMLDHKPNMDIVKHSFINAAKDGKIESVSFVLSAYPNMGGIDEALYYATSNDINIVELLLRKGANVNCVGYKSATPLMRATEHGTLEMMKYLVSKGATIESKNKEGMTPLIIAAAAGKLLKVKYLLSIGANSNAKDNNGLRAIDHSKKWKAFEETTNYLSTFEVKPDEQKVAQVTISNNYDNEARSNKNAEKSKIDNKKEISSKLLFPNADLAKTGTTCRSINTEDIFDKLMNEHKFAEAIKYADSNIPASSRDACFWVKLGTAYENLKLNEEALTFYLVAINRLKYNMQVKMDTKSYNAYLSAARVCNKLKRYESAVNYAKNAIELNATKDAGIEYNRSLSALGKHDTLNLSISKVANTDSAKIYKERFSIAQAEDILKNNGFRVDIIRYLDCIKSARKRDSIYCSFAQHYLSKGRNNNAIEFYLIGQDTATAISIGLKAADEAWAIKDYYKLSELWRIYLSNIKHDIVIKKFTAYRDSLFNKALFQYTIGKEVLTKPLDFAIHFEEFDRHIRCWKNINSYDQIMSYIKNCGMHSLKAEMFIIYEMVNQINIAPGTDMNLINRLSDKGESITYAVRCSEILIQLRRSSINKVRWNELISHSKTICNTLVLSYANKLNNGNMTQNDNSLLKKYNNAAIAINALMNEDFKDWH